MYKEITETNIDKMIELFEAGETYLSISKAMGYDKSTVSKYLQSRGYISPFINKSLEIVDDKGKCKRCGKLKPLINYKVGKRTNKDGTQTYHAVCTRCKHAARIKNLNRDVNKRLRNIFTKKKLRSNFEFTISWEEFKEQFDSQDGKCFYTDIEMTWQLGKGSNKDNTTRLSVDRIDPLKGYVSNNVVFCTKRANMAKNDFTLEEMKEWMPKWYERALSKLQGSSLVELVY